MRRPADPLVGFWVDGIPATQGSKTPNRGGRGFHEADKKLPAWRDAIQVTSKGLAAVLDGAPYDFPLLARLDVYLQAPAKSKFGQWPAGKPDLDKLQRAVGDGLTAGGLIKDDARIVAWRARKHWTEEGMSPGARIQLEDLRDELYTPAEQEELLPTLRAAAHEFSTGLLETFGPSPIKVRGVVPMPHGEQQMVELTLEPKLAALLRQGILGGVSVQGPVPDPIQVHAAAWRAKQVEP